MKRSILGGIYGVLLVTAATACGGTVSVSPGKGTPRDQLQSNGPERCKAACVTIATCGLGSQSCACSCPACAAGSTSCECPPCDCTQDSTSPEKCESDCNDAVQQILKDKPDCDNKMLALLDCLGAATCKTNEKPCNAEQDAMKGCSESHASPPPTAGGGSDPGSSSSSSGSAGSGSAGSSSGSGSAGSSGAASSGSVICSKSVQALAAILGGTQSLHTNAKMKHWPCRPPKRPSLPCVRSKF